MHMSRLCSALLETSSKSKAAGVPNNNMRDKDQVAVASEEV